MDFKTIDRLIEFRALISELNSTYLHTSSLTKVEEGLDEFLDEVLIGWKKHLEKS